MIVDLCNSQHVNPNYDPDIESGEGSEDHNPLLIQASAGEIVPEPFVWYYLKQMAVASHRMSNIPTRQNKGHFVVHQ